MNLQYFLAPRLGVALALVGALAVPVIARSATLDIRGPGGAAVYIDGEWRGTLPLDSPLEVDKGDHDLELRRSGYETLRQSVQVASEDADMVMQLDMLSLQRWKATTYSALLAGLGQHYEGRARRGWTMMGLQVAAATVAAIGEAQFQSSRDDYEILDRKYEASISPREIASLRAQRDQAYDDMGSAETLRNAALVGVVAVGLWSVVDAYLGFDDLYVEVAGAPAPSNGARDASSLRLGWRVGF